MLRKIIVFITIVIIVSCSKEQLTPIREQKKIISGKILGFDGKPLEMAHLHATIYNSNIKKISVATDKDGNFKIEYDKSDLKLSLNFTGVYHYSELLDIYNIDLPDKVELNVKLKPYTFKPQEKGLVVIGNFNNFSFTYNTIPMELDEDGKYYAMVPNKSDTLFYQILGALPFERSINGTMSHGYVYDGGGDYCSYIVTDTSL